MHSTYYLYNIEPTEFIHLPYAEALEMKLEAAKSLYFELYEKDLRSEEEEIRMFYVRQAKEHTEGLINEYKG